MRNSFGDYLMKQKLSTMQKVKREILRPFRKLVGGGGGG